VEFKLDAAWAEVQRTGGEFPSVCRVVNLIDDRDTFIVGSL